jgi:hypothetical protein
MVYENESEQGYIHQYNQQKREHIKLNHPSWQIEFRPGKNILYAKVYDNAPRTITLGLLQTPAQFHQWQIRSIATMLLFVITLISICIVIALGASYIKSPYFNYYGLYLVGLIFDFLAYKGWGAAFLWREDPFLLSNIRSISNTLSSIGISLFFYHFYLTFYVPKWATQIFKLMGIYFTGVFLLFFLKAKWGGFEILIQWVFYSIQLGALIIISIHSYLAIKKHIPIYLPVVFILHTLSIFIQIKTNFSISGNLNIDILSVNMYYTTLLIEIVVLTYYIIQQMWSIKEENKLLG